MTVPFKFLDPEELIELAITQQDVIDSEIALNHTQGRMIAALQAIINSKTDLEKCEIRVTGALGELNDFQIKMAEKYAEENRLWSQKELEQEVEDDSVR